MSSVKSHVFVFLVLVLPIASIVFGILTATPRPSVSILTVLCLTYIFLLRQIVIPHYTSPLRHFPSPAEDILEFGHGRAFLSKPKGKQYLEWAKTTPNDGLLRVRGHFYMRQSLLLTSLEALSDVLVKRPYKFRKEEFARDFLRTVIGNGLIVAEGREHKAQRKAVWPSFQGRHVRDLVPLFWRKSLDFVDILGKEMLQVPEAGVVEVGNLISRATLDVIGVAGFGHEFGSLHSSGDELAGHFAAVTDSTNPVLLLNFVAGFLFPRFIVDRLPGIGNDIIIDGSAMCRRRCLKLLAAKRAMLKDKSVDRPNAIVEVLLASGEIDDESLVDQLLTFLAAGHETTASALQWTAYELARNPKMQQQVRDEVSAAFSTGSEVDADLIESMPYLNAVCMETLRMYPTVPVTGRTATEDTTVAGVFIPKGTHTMAAPMVINQLPKFWRPDADRYRPERWIRTDGNTNGGATHPLAFLTFLAGARSCIGQTFAKLELKCFVGALVTRFRFEMARPGEEVIAGGFITIKPEGGLHLRLVDLCTAA